MKRVFTWIFKYVFVCSLLFLSIMLNASAQSTDKSSNERYNVTANRVAIKGYDPVSYFTENAAREGKESVSYIYDGITYRFANQQHLDAFKLDPERYKPQYGGWCAYAMGASGEKVDIDPATFKLLNGKLYLFYNRFFNNTKKSWDKDETNLKKRADANWQKISR
jgi:YHS domain-containing protein